MGGEAHDITGVDERLAAWDGPPRSMLADKGYNADRLREDLLITGVNPIKPSPPKRTKPPDLWTTLKRSSGTPM